MSFNLRQPTIFESSDEVQDAVNCGYLDVGYGYLHNDVNCECFPTVIWNNDSYWLAHQGNELGQWSRYSDIIEKAIKWSDIKVLHPKLLIKIPEEVI